MTGTANGAQSWKDDPDHCSIVVLYAWLDMEAAKLHQKLKVACPEYAEAQPEDTWAAAVEAVVEAVQKSAAEWGERR